MLILQRVRLPNGEEACEVRHDMVGANETQMCYSYADVAVLDALVAAPVVHIISLIGASADARVLPTIATAA